MKYVGVTLVPVNQTVSAELQHAVSVDVTHVNVRPVAALPVLINRMLKMHQKMKMDPKKANESVN